MPGINGACDVPHAAWLRSSLVALCSAVAACVIGDQPSYMCIMSGRRWGGCGTDMSVDREHTDELRDERHVMRERSEMRSARRHHSQPMFTLEFMEGRELRPTR